MREGPVPQGQGRCHGGRNKVRHEGVEGDGGHTGRLAPGRPVERVGRVRRGPGDEDNGGVLDAVRPSGGNGLVYNGLVSKWSRMGKGRVKTKKVEGNQTHLAERRSPGARHP